MDKVHFGGQVGQRDLPRWYHMADMYISPIARGRYIGHFIESVGKRTSVFGV